ncbi:MAG: zf-HC2 domain-containing protein [Thermodesulfobacteriota bacterium]
MDCQQALINKDDYLDRTLSAGETLELQQHLFSCSECRNEFQRDEELLKALRRLPVPPPNPDFVKRSFATARARHKKQQIKKAMPYWGGAVAACLAFWLMVATPVNQTTPAVQPPSSSHAINIKIHEERLVQVVVRAPRDLFQADVVIELPTQLEMAGFPGQREIRWNTNLRKGKNLLNLPLVAKSRGTAELITHISHDNKSKMLSLVMTVYNDELTRKGHYMPHTA